MCFICGLERPTFEKLGQGRFEEHIQHDHPATHYMFFILLLKVCHGASCVHARQLAHGGGGLQDIPVGEQSSLQAHIHRCILKQDTSWMPHGHATCLEEQHGVPEKQDVLMQVGQMLEASAKQLTHRIEQVAYDVAQPNPPSCTSLTAPLSLHLPHCTSLTAPPSLHPPHCTPLTAPPPSLAHCTSLTAPPSLLLPSSLLE